MLLGTAVADTCIYILGNKCLILQVLVHGISRMLELSYHTNSDRIRTHTLGSIRRVSVPIRIRQRRQVSRHLGTQPSCTTLLLQCMCKRRIPLPMFLQAGTQIWNCRLNTAHLHHRFLCFNLVIGRNSHKIAFIFNCSTSKPRSSFVSFARTHTLTHS